VHQVGYLQESSNVSFSMLLNDSQLLRVYVSWLMNMEHWRNDIDRRKRKQPEKNLSHCYSVHHKAQTDWPQIEPDLHSEKPVATHLSHGMVPITLLREAFSSDFIFMCREFFRTKYTCWNTRTYRIYFSYLHYFYVEILS